MSPKSVNVIIIAGSQIYLCITRLGGYFGFNFESTHLSLKWKNSQCCVKID